MSLPRDKSLRKVMVLGSGPIVIGQAAEFDYAGTQACKALAEEGLEVVLVNSNPATIMTDPEMAARVYLEPLVPDVVAEIIRRERPDGLLPTLGGQTGLNLAVDLMRDRTLEQYGVRLLGTPLSAIERAEDRKLFKETMLALGEPVPVSAIVSDLPAAMSFAAGIGYPVIVRPAFTLGGTGGGIAHNEEALRAIAGRGLSNSPIHQVLIEKSVAGWKEIEYEVMRDADGNALTVCNMENLDPVGIHTGDSIVVAPSQTLSDREYQMLRRASLRIIDALAIEGGCNVQFALDPSGEQYYVIEVNPRVSRSSALASKATGYPIARVAAKIAAGLRLWEIKNAVTGRTFASFEPALDYVVVKMPCWPFDKFRDASRSLGTQMKATGEVMAIDRSFRGALGKAVRSLETNRWGLLPPDFLVLTDRALLHKLENADDERLFAVAAALARGWDVGRINGTTGIDPWFLQEIAVMVNQIRHARETDWLSLKQSGHSDRALGQSLDMSEEKYRRTREERGISPVYQTVDTCAAEFDAVTPYYYSSYGQADDGPPASGRNVLVVGSGPIRIGQGIEFDYCSVHAVKALQSFGRTAIIVNNNPETVSTDFDVADRLYFEPLTFEDVMNVIQREQPEGVLVQFGGQTALNLAGPLARAGVRILGTGVDGIDQAEDRERFFHLLASLGIRQAEGGSATSVAEAVGIADKIGYPVMVRPSYVIGGRAMQVVQNEAELFGYIQLATTASPSHPILVDRYLFGKEVEVDAVSDGTEVFIPGIMEHIERAGVHSGDSMAVYPPVSLDEETAATIVDYTIRIGRALKVRGLLNIQFVVRPDGRVYVLEVNPRSSRTVPIISKVTGVPLVRLAVGIALGRGLSEMGYHSGLLPAPGYFMVKAPVFSFEKLNNVDISLGPEMKSTGEVLGLAVSYEEALAKAMRGAGIRLPEGGEVLASVADRDKEEALPYLSKIAALGFGFAATSGTAEFLRHHGFSARTLLKIGEGLPNVVDAVTSGRISLVVNTPTRGRVPERTGFMLRRAAVEYRVPCLTSLDTLRALVTVLEARAGSIPHAPRALQDYLAEFTGGTALKAAGE